MTVVNEGVEVYCTTCDKPILLRYTDDTHELVDITVLEGWEAPPLTCPECLEKRANNPEPKPYDQRPWNDPLCLEALEHCPWKDTDHDGGTGSRRDNYCTWCDGYVTALVQRGASPR